MTEPVKRIIGKFRHWKQQYRPDAVFVWRKTVLWNGAYTVPGTLIPDRARRKLRSLWEAGIIELAQVDPQTHGLPPADGQPEGEGEQPPAEGAPPAEAPESAPEGSDAPAVVGEGAEPEAAEAGAEAAGEADGESEGAAGHQRPGSRPRKSGAEARTRRRGKSQGKHTR